MKEKSPAFQWYPKQYLGDDNVLAMDWDAKGMHVHLFNISWQQEPVGSIPDDMALIRRWLNLPSGKPEWCQQAELGTSYFTGCRCPECVWRRVKPQIFSAWKLRDGRWFCDGIVRAWERQQTYKQNGSKTKAKVGAKREQLAEEEDEEVKKPEKSWSGDDLAHHLLREAGIVSYGDLPQVVSKALSLKQNNSGWTMEKVFEHMLEHCKAAKGARYRGKWVDWFAGGDYDKPPEAWQEKPAMKTDRGYIPLRPKA